jgi:protease PrsW
MVTLLFNGVGILLLFQFFKFKYLDFIAESHKTNFWKFARHKYVLTVGAILIITLGIVELFLPDVSPLRSDMNRLNFGNYLGVLVAFAISVIWMIYLRKLDVFEPEEWKHIIIVFLMGCTTVWAVFPITEFMKTYAGFQLNNEIFNDFIYSWVGIGMVEELIKMVPLIIIVRFRKIVNEPYDFLLYASVSALGFAFIENAVYIERTDFYAINGRALMSTVAHMTFSSIIGYGMLISSCRGFRKGWHYILGAFLVASLMHGFYDFWLINPIAREFSGLSFVFFILTTHFWFTLKNKTINASYFYDETKRISNDSIRYFIILWMVVLLMVSTLLIGVFHGSSTANTFLLGQLYSFGFLIYYLGFSFSRFVIAPKAINACQVALEKVIPKEPSLKTERD